MNNLWLHVWVDIWLDLIILLIYIIEGDETLKNWSWTGITCLIIFINLILIPLIK